ncbi:DNA-processing protein DprA [Phyllobacterium myrsinacearum]|uniref:DNA processing protein n=1 Tax=Phyllobacterium myrsinacearum TaxID=28101 RepID=A0A839EG54_9HYPH|nr:DNA-processing protein DprA [Phyllobacterium myrsinacearum]MBA8877882.1 DNA processing protein [Phyllobacterium myrsinacearum]
MHASQLKASRGWNDLDDQKSKVPASKCYSPPDNISTVMLSDALEDTGRFPEKRQMSFLEKQAADRAIADMKLYFTGDLSLLKRPCVAIVGTRQVSDAGRLRTQRLARELVKAGVVVVSGLAYGVDAVAHQTAIDSGGSTIAVLGTPLDRASPSENAPLQEEIYRRHLLLSQFEVGEPTFRTNFPLRNKLMATIADATVVMEASDTSGTLHQAAACTKLGRWLFIARSVVDDSKLTWPTNFLKYETCVPLDKVSDITSRIANR